jgi:hypothetical protein
MSILKLKRSAVANKIPLTTDLDLGELAINTNDGKLFLKRNNGTDSIREIGAVTVDKNGTAVGTRRNINFIEGTNITLTIADDSANDEVDITIAAAGGGATNLDSLTDVVITSPSTGQVLKYNGTNWINDTDATGGGGGNLDSLTDVIITTPTNTQVLKYNGTNWVNAADTVGATTVDELTDVVIGGSTSLAAADVLSYNGTEWENNPEFASSIITLLDVVAPRTRQSNTSAIVAMSVGTTAPSSPAVGDLWVDTN